MSTNGGAVSVRFRKRSWVVHPAHGVARVVDREQRKIDGQTVACLVLEVPARDGFHGPIRISVPEERAEELGIRLPVDLDEAHEVLQVLAVDGARVPSNWSRRFKNHQEKLRSGDVYQCAEVVRNLARRDRDAHLSTGERAMYERARYLLATELAASWGVELAEAEERIEAAARGGR